VAVTLRQIQAFIAVAQQGTFTKAAERMQIAQPALSQLVRELERVLNVRLLDRTTRRVELTDAGREFHAAAVQILHELDAAVQNAADLAARKRGRITVAVPPLLAAIALPPAIAALRDTHPGLQVTIIDARNDLVIEAVRSGRADCGIGTFSSLEDGIERTPLARDSLMLFCTGQSRFAHQTSVAWRELRGEPLVTLTRDSGIRLLVEVGYESAEVPLFPAYEVSQISTALALVRFELAIAVLPTYARAVVPAGVLAKPLTEPSIARDIVMIRASGRSVSPALSTFETLLRRFVRQSTPSEDA
jgi:DNA-binding transcriptional LysR family regulator